MVAMQAWTPGSKQQKLVAFFKGLTLFANMSDDALVRFADATHLKRYKQGEYLFLEGQHADFFYIISGGWLKLFHTTSEGKEVALEMLTENSILGENAIFEEGLFTSGAQVVESAEILSVPLALLKEQLSVNSTMAFNMLASMMQYKRQYEVKFKQHILYSAPQRMGAFLLGLCPKLGQKDDITLIIPYDRALIASTLRMSGATFSRALNILVEETGIQIAGTRVKIDSVGRLLKFVNGCYVLPALHKV